MDVGTDVEMGHDLTQVLEGAGMTNQGKAINFFNSF